MIKKFKKVILGIVEDKFGNILITQRIDPKIPNAHLKWDLIGGKQEKNEKKEDTVIRECSEETGYKIKIVKLLKKTIKANWQHEEYSLEVHLFCYQCKILSGELRLGDHKVKKIKLVPREKILDLDLLSTTRKFLEYYLSQKEIH